MEPVSILMPGGLRLRSVRPLADRDGSYPLLYDLERSHLIGVPEQFRLYVDSALETGDLDEDLLAWLANEDVLTYERGPGGGRGGWAGVESWATPENGQWGRARAGFAVGQVLFFRDRVHSRLGLDSEAATLADLSALLRQTGGATALTLELGGEEPVRRFDLIRRVAEEAERHERLTSREVTFQLTVDPAAVTPAVAAFLAGHRFQVRFALDGSSALAAEAGHAGLRLLLDRAPERVTVHALLAAGERLGDLWRWAKAAGVQRFDATKVYDVPVTDLPRHEAEVRAFRGDLFALCDELYAALEQGRSLPLYEPIARIVRRLIAGRPLTAGAGCEDGYLGLVNNGEVVPFCGGPYRLLLGGRWARRGRRGARHATSAGDRASASATPPTSPPSVATGCRRANSAAPKSKWRCSSSAGCGMPTPPACWASRPTGPGSTSTRCPARASSN